MNTVEIMSLLVVALTVIIFLISKSSKGARIVKNKNTSFYVKIVFSVIFTIACLYIVLLGDHDEATKEWAFSVLSLILGVWLGTIS